MTEHTQPERWGLWDVCHVAWRVLLVLVLLKALVHG